MSEEDMVLIVMRERGNTASAMDSTLYMYIYERYLASYLGMVSPRWVLQISSDRDDQMGQILKSKKNP